MKQIPLTQGKFAIVDDEDYPYLNRFTWHLIVDRLGTESVGTTLYQSGFHSEKKRTVVIFMQCFLIQNKSSFLVCHKNKDVLDFRKDNLILVPSRVTVGKRSKYISKKSSKYKWVFKSSRGKTFFAQIQHDGKLYARAYFSTEREAAIYINKKAKELYGDFAYQNIIN